MEKSRENYRLVIMNNETFEEIGSYRLSLLNVYIAASLVIVTVAVLIFALIALTPIKRYIPGYGDVRQYEEVMRLNKQLTEIEEELKAQTIYTDNFRRILVGEIEEPPSEVNQTYEIPDSLLNVDRIKEDELLRKEIELNEQLLSLIHI